MSSSVRSCAAPLCEKSLYSEPTQPGVFFNSGHTWLHDDKMLVGADNGDLLLFDNAGASIGSQEKVDDVAVD